jgi:hypothetical protein
MSTDTDYKKGERAFRGFLNGYGIILANIEDKGLRTSDDGWDHFAWELTVRNRYAPDSPISRKDSTGYTFPYMQGTAHTKEPTLTDLMSSLLSDAQTVLDRDFAEWAGDLGYDEDSRTAEKLYNQIVDDNAKLCKLFRTTDLAAVLEKARPLMEAAGL